MKPTLKVDEGGRGKRVIRADTTLAELRKTSPPVAPEVELVRKAFEIIGSPQRVAKWMRTPLKALRDRTPYSLLGSEEGRKEVDTVLGRIEHGVY